MSEEQLSALFAKLEEDAGLREKLQSAANIDAALAIAKEAGFDVSKADFEAKAEELQTLKLLAKKDLSDEDLESVAGSADSRAFSEPSTRRHEWRIWGEGLDFYGVEVLSRISQWLPNR